MSEPDVTLTDYGLALESVVFVSLLLRRHANSGELFWFITYFMSAAVAAFCGGTVHGYFLDPDSLGHAVLWPATLVAIGANAVAVWAIGANLLFAENVARRFISAAVLLFLAYSGFVVWGVGAFQVVIWMAFPAALFLIAVLGYLYWRERRAGALLMAAGLATTMLAVLLQQLGVRVHPVYFSHNAVAHVVQALALLLVYLGGVRLLNMENSRKDTLPDVASVSPTVIRR